MKISIYLVVLIVGAVMLIPYISASGEADDGQLSANGCDPVVTVLETEIPPEPTNTSQPTNTPELTNTPAPTNTPDPTPIDTPKEPKPSKTPCDQGRGNGDDFCSPGNSDNKHGPNDPQRGRRR